jgi:hypothetical protein
MLMSFVAVLLSMSALRDSLLGRKDQGVVAEATQYCPSLSYKTRLYGFGILLALAWLCGILSGVVLFLGQTVVFAVLYTISNIFGLGSTFFLVGPKAQLKKMFKVSPHTCVLFPQSSLPFFLYSPFVFGLPLLFFCSWL